MNKQENLKSAKEKLLFKNLALESLRYSLLLFGCYVLSSALLEDKVEWMYFISTFIFTFFSIRTVRKEWLEAKVLAVKARKEIGRYKMEKHREEFLTK